MKESEFLEMLVQLSGAISKTDGQFVDMLRILYTDLANVKIELEEAKSAFDLFKILRVAGILKPTDISILFETIELTGLRYLKEIIEKYETYPDEVKITRFSPHRQQVVALGRGFSVDDVQRVSQLHGGNFFPNPWKLVQHLEDTNVLTKDKMPSFLQHLKENEVNEDFNQLLVELSDAIRKKDEQYVDMLRILYTDLANVKTKLEEAKSAFHLFQILRLADILKPTDISILFETIEITGLRYLKEIIEKYKTYPDEVKITRFTPHRQHVVALGKDFSTLDVQRVCQKYEVPVGFCSNPWTLITYLENEGIVSEDNFSSFLMNLRSIKGSSGSGEASTSKRPKLDKGKSGKSKQSKRRRLDKGSGEASTSKRPKLDKGSMDFQTMLMQVSRWYDECKLIDKLKVLYKDMVTRDVDLLKSRTTMDLFELLIQAGHLKSTDLKVLIDTINVTDTRGVLEVSDVLRNAHDETNLTAFSFHRQKLIQLGNVLSATDVWKLAYVYEMAQNQSEDQWTLIFNLEIMGVIRENQMRPFIAVLKGIELHHAATMLEELKTDKIQTIASMQSMTSTGNSVFQTMLMQVSAWYDDHKLIDKLKVLYKDMVTEDDLLKSRTTMDLFILLIRNEHLKSTDLKVLVDTINVTDTRGVLDVSDVLRNAHDETNLTTLTTFSIHRQKLIQLGNVLLADNVLKLTYVYEMAQSQYEDQWTLILNLEIMGVIRENQMRPFIAVLKGIELHHAATMLEEELKTDKIQTIDNMQSTTSVSSTDLIVTHVVGCSGGDLELKDAGIKLHIPPGAIKEGVQLDISLENVLKDADMPVCRHLESRIAPIVACGPPGTVFNTPCSLSFPHNAVNEESWEFTVLTSESSHDTWKRIESNDKDTTVSVKNGRFFIKTNHFTKYTSYGRCSIDSKKILMLGLFGRMLTEIYLLRVRTWNPHHKKKVEKEEGKLGEVCVDAAKPITVQYKDLDISIQVHDGWHVEGTKRVTLEALHIWESLPSHAFYLKKNDALKQEIGIQLSASHGSDFVHESLSLITVKKEGEDGPSMTARASLLTSTATLSTPTEGKDGPSASGRTSLTSTESAKVEDGRSASATASALTSTGTSYMDFQTMLTQVSTWYDRYKLINKLKVLYKDMVTTDNDLLKSRTMMDLFELLIRAGHLKSTNLKALIDMINVTDTRGVVDVSDLLRNAHDETSIAAFSIHRQKLIQLGNVLSADDVKKLGKLYNMAEREYEDQWTLILNLEIKRVIHENQMPPFIAVLKGIELYHAATTLEEELRTDNIQSRTSAKKLHSTTENPKICTKKQKTEKNTERTEFQNPGSRSYCSESPYSSDEKEITRPAIDTNSRPVIQNTREKINTRKKKYPKKSAFH